MIAIRTRRARGGGVFAVTVAAFVAVCAAPAVGALPDTSSPTLRLQRTIRTTPFVNTKLSMEDGEGSAFVPNDPSHPNINGTDSLWLVEDNGRSAWEVNPYTGALKSHIGDAEWQATKQYSAATQTGSGPTAGPHRDPDIESAAYDRATDTLYVFSGKCCSSSVLPTAYRLKRGTDGTFHPESWQALPTGSDYTASAWDPVDRRIYVGVGSDLRTYDFVTNTPGSIFHISNLSGILGMSFSDNGADLFVARSSVKLSRVHWATRTLDSGWTFALTSFGMRDSRAVELINDQFYVFDGYDGRSTGDPLRHAVFVFDVCCGSAVPPTASFTWLQVAPPALTVQFTDTSTGSPTSWLWDFGDGSTSTQRNPSHTYAAAGNHTATLIASNSNGSSAPATQTIDVTAPMVPPTASFTWSQVADPPLTIAFADASTGSPTSWSWDFGDSSTATTQDPTHTYAAAGDYIVTLIASNSAGSSLPVTHTITVTLTPAQTVFTPVADSYVVFDAPDRNYGDADALHAKLSTVNEKRPYFTFSVTGLQGQTVASAKLRLFVTDSSPSGGDWYTVSPNWIETGAGSITWNNAPPITGTKFATAGVATAGTWLEIDLTGIVTGDATYGFAMKTQNSDTVYFSSKEGVNPPQLLVTLQ